MNILVLNAGSSSIKYQLIDMPNQIVRCVGLVERIGFDDAIFSHSKGTKKHQETLAILDHTAGLKKIANTLMDKNIGVISDVDEIDAVGHRVVHGGSRFTETILINDVVKKSIEKLSDLAPLHNPPNFIGIGISESVFPKAKQVAVFDTAFHQTIPKKAYQYAIPNQFLKDNKIRVYGFHGTSHKYVSEKAIEYLKKEKSKLITIHLGNGCSMSAIEDGKCIDTSLGFGPMNGLVMGTRSGDVDQSIILFMNETLGYSLEKIKQILQKESGLKGLTGYSDLREVEAEALKGNQDCINALQITTYRIKKYIGAYTAALNGLDAIVFTAGIGENSQTIREMVCQNMEYLGIEIDSEKNKDSSKQIKAIERAESTVKILVIPTNEELEIAKQTYDLIK